MATDYRATAVASNEYEPYKEPQASASRRAHAMSLEAILSPVLSDCSTSSSSSSSSLAARRTPESLHPINTRGGTSASSQTVTTSPIQPILVHPTPARRSFVLQAPPPQRTPSTYTSPASVSSDTPSYAWPQTLPHARSAIPHPRRESEPALTRSSAGISGWMPSPGRTCETIDPSQTRYWRPPPTERPRHASAYSEAQGIEDALNLLHHRGARVSPDCDRDGAPHAGVPPSVAYAVAASAQRERRERERVVVADATPAAYDPFVPVTGRQHTAASTSGVSATAPRRSSRREEISRDSPSVSDACCASGSSPRSWSSIVGLNDKQK